MKAANILLLLCGVIIHTSSSLEISHVLQNKGNTETAEDTETSRGRRDVIEEEKYYNIRSDIQKDTNQPTPWIPGPLPPEDPTTKVVMTNPEVKEVLPLYQTTERVTDKPTGRGARASNENWIKLPYPGGRDDAERDNILTPPQPSGELLNSRMPRVDFVTQNKGLETSESRNDKETIQRSSRNDDIRTDFVRPDEDDRKNLNLKPVYPRQAVYYPEESRRYFDDRYYPADDLYRSRDPYYDSYDPRRRAPYPIPGYGPRVDRFDEAYDIPRKPKRIIYYAHLPEVVRTPPSVDLRYRYSGDPYRRFDDDYGGRSGRYDYRFRNRYPYAPLRKEERIYRDLAGAGSTKQDKKVDEKITAAPVLPQKDEGKFKPSPQLNRNINRNVINSHQYHDGVEVHYSDPMSHKGFQDVVRPDDGYLRYDEPLFESAIDDPYRQKY